MPSAVTDANGIDHDIGMDDTLVDAILDMDDHWSTPAEENAEKIKKLFGHLRDQLRAASHAKTVQEYTTRNLASEFTEKKISWKLHPWRNQFRTRPSIV